ncbi:MAG TPA: rhomboid family intramembrane serine protease [Nannocystaceae bacterium]|nr:rhomboid family intramembrane serine protease [Nannocystaceae bacterium]
MRLLSEHADTREAHRLADALLVASIETDVREGTQWEVWVRDDDDLARARELLAAFRAGAIDEGASRRAREIRAEQKAADIGWAQRFVHARSRWRGAETIAAQPLTIAMIVATLAAAWATRLGDPTTPALQWLSIEPWPPGAFLSHVRAGEWWRLLTPMFLHFGPVHLVFNMLWLDRLGRQVEHRHGILVMVLVVVTSELVGSLGQYWFHGPSFGGMSGVNYGLFGFVWMYARFDRRRGYVIDDMAVVLLTLWFVACATGLFGPIANIGHAGGLVAGLALGLPPYLTHLKARRTELPETPGSWADVHLTGWRRFRRRVLTPYMPLWFLALAAIVIAAEWI